MDEFEVREVVIDSFDIFDLVELLGLSTEDLIDKFDVLGFDEYRSIILEKLFS